MLLDEIRNRWADAGSAFSRPIIRMGASSVSLDDILHANRNVVDSIPPCSVVAHIGEFTHSDISMLLGLIDSGCIIAPLTDSTAHQHELFFDDIGAEWVIQSGDARSRPVKHPAHPLIAELKSKKTAGLILFSSGTTGAPKAAVHDFSKLLDKFRAYKRPPLRTLAFLLFDHIGGLNTLFHTLYNAGTIHVPISRQPSAVMKQVVEEKINLIPTTPSFLRLALVERAFGGLDLSQLKLVTYGTERMDQTTLDRLNQTLPDHVDIRQTYGMSELGIFPVKNRSKRELWICITDPNIEVEARDGVLWIRSPHRMLGYLNAPGPFDKNGWFNTRDLVEFDGRYLRILGRNDEVINVGGIKVHPKEIEEAAYALPEVCYAKVQGEPNPLLGQHIRLDVHLVEGVSISKGEIRAKLSKLLGREKMPHRIGFREIPITDRFKMG